jgi:MoaA/NifB/PqqE/SkfB family radical SAM enzyme
VIPGPVFARAPRRVYWEVTRACDLACRHCRAAATATPDADELATGQAFGLIERLADFGPPLPHLVLTGGDPLKRRDLFSLIGFARALGFPVAVAPSATPLLTPAAIRRLASAGVEAISLSLDGSDAARHDALRGITGTFERTLEAAEAARAVKLPFQVNTLVSRETLHDLPAIGDLVGRLGAARWSLFFLVSVGRGAVLEPISSEECDRLFQWLADRPPGGPVTTTTEAPHFRRVLSQRRRAAGRPAPAAAHGAAGIRDGNGIMFISSVGLVYPSGFFTLPAGRVTDESPVDIYRQSPLFRTLRRVDLFGGRCGRCDFRGLCGGSRARALAASGDPLAEDPLCAYSPTARALETALA